MRNHMPTTFKSALSHHLKIDNTISVITLLHELKNDDKTNMCLLIESNDN